MIHLGEHFREIERRRRARWLHRQQGVYRAQQEEQRRKDDADLIDDSLMSFAIEVVRATKAEIQAYRERVNRYETQLNAYESRLDIYDAAVIAALIDNQQFLDLVVQQLAEVNDVLREMLAGAYVLEDGRRVFKSEDGSYVIDEHGNHVGRDEVDYDLVTGPTAESYLEVADRHEHLRSEQARLIDEREQLLQAQGKIDAARGEIAAVRTQIDWTRQELDSDGLTTDDLEALDAALLDAMPDSLPTLPPSALKKLSGLENKETAPAAKSSFSATSLPSTAKDLGSAPTSTPEPE